VLFEPGQEDTAEFLAEQGVEGRGVAALLHARPTSTRSAASAFRAQRRALRRSTRSGYASRAAARARPGHNPLGASCPEQAELEASYSASCATLGIEFDRPATITNMPIKRFAHALEREAPRGVHAPCS
jgi:hypothetical protein